MLLPGRRMNEHNWHHTAPLTSHLQVIMDWVYELNTLLGRVSLVDSPSTNTNNVVQFNKAQKFLQVTNPTPTFGKFDYTTLESNVDLL